MRYVLGMTTEGLHVQGTLNVPATVVAGSNTDIDGQFDEEFEVVVPVNDEVQIQATSNTGATGALAVATSVE